MKSAFHLVVLIAVSVLPMPVQSQTMKAMIVPTQKSDVDSVFVQPLPPRPSMLPDGVVSAGSGTIRNAWLSHPTTRYAHGVIGDAIEAGGLAVETSGGALPTLALDADAVFEDRIARIVRLDGEDGVLVVKSYLERGSALAFVRVESAALRIAAESPAIGTKHRWLNPVGVADFDGDGRDEVAAILTPHIGGVLTLYRRNGSALDKVYSAPGFSNHKIGTRELGWSAILDANGDGIPDIVAPDTDRRSLRIVTFAGGKFAELAQVTLPTELASSFSLAAPALVSGPSVFFALADGKGYKLNFTR